MFHVVKERGTKQIPVPGREKLSNEIEAKCANQPVRTVIYSYNTRFRENLDVPMCRIATARRSFHYRSINTWNSLRAGTRNSKTLCHTENLVADCITTIVFYMSLEYLSVNNQHIYIVYRINYRSYFVLVYTHSVILVI